MSTVSQLLYTSHNRPDRFLEDLGAILKEANAHNESQGITGFLIATDSHYVQLLEGDPSRVDDLFYRIRQDERHANIQLVFERRMGERFFPGWTLRGLASPEMQDRLARALGQDRLAPAELSTGDAQALVSYVRAQNGH